MRTLAQMFDFRGSQRPKESGKSPKSSVRMIFDGLAITKMHSIGALLFLGILLMWFIPRGKDYPRKSGIESNFGLW